MVTSSNLRSSVPAILAAGALLLAGCASTDAAPDEAAVAAFAHIHALAVDPATGELLIATHEGIYTVDPANPAKMDVRGPLGGLDFDPMGFTVTASGAYASGHPGFSTPAQLGGPNLGLIRSVDGGQNWTTVSLKNETDFHAVTVGPPASTGGQPAVYGLDSSTGTVRRSDDAGLTWRDGAAVLARTILADPLLPGTVYATTADGLVVSTDGGTTFTVDDDAPILYLMASDPAGALIGIDTSGVLWSREPSGVWMSGGQVTGTPQAVTVDGERVYLADDRGIAYTDDRGTNWEILEPTG